MRHATPRHATMPSALPLAHPRAGCGQLRHTAAATVHVLLSLLACPHAGHAGVSPVESDQSRANSVRGIDGAGHTTSQAFGRIARQEQQEPPGFHYNGHFREGPFASTFVCVRSHCLPLRRSTCEHVHTRACLQCDVVGLAALQHNTARLPDHDARTNTTDCVRDAQQPPSGNRRSACNSPSTAGCSWHRHTSKQSLPSQTQNRTRNLSVARAAWRASWAFRGNISSA